MEALVLAHRLADIVRTARDEENMAGDLLRTLHAELGSFVSAIYLVEPDGGRVQEAVRGAPEGRLDQYRTEMAGRAMDPMLRAALERRAPVHDQLLYRSTWEEQRFHAENTKRFGTAHYLVAPFLGARDVVGTVHLTRSPNARPFGERDLHFAGLAAAHVAVALGTRAVARSRRFDLTFRELQVARLACSGLDNPQIAVRLDLARETIKKTLGRAYDKLGVKSRAEMAAVLARAGRV